MSQIVSFNRAFILHCMKTNNLKASSRGGLMVELWTDNSLSSATVGSNLHQVWCIYIDSIQIPEAYIVETKKYRS